MTKSFFIIVLLSDDVHIKSPRGRRNPRPRRAVYEDKRDVFCRNYLKERKRGRQATGHRPQATGHRPQAAGHRPQATGDRPQATGHRPQATGHRPQATGHRPQATGH
ncbi:MAG: DUF1720 domain-containing protein, partial [Treponema sp.]|nr:DUF1720 domain-containing protein [Treponema sp.]